MDGWSEFCQNDALNVKPKYLFEDWSQNQLFSGINIDVGTLGRGVTIFTHFIRILQKIIG